LTLVGAVREQTGKLERHELRERQLGDALTRSLRDLDSRTRGQDKNLENLAILMARTDERLRKMEEMVIQVTSSRSIIKGQISTTIFYIRGTRERGFNSRKSLTIQWLSAMELNPEEVPVLLVVLLRQPLQVEISAKY
jgi:hypothetical protein